jgi:DNA-binding response OmpR family regulator
VSDHQFETPGDTVAEPLNVLILDDEPGIRATLGRFLELYGYRSIETASVDQAVEAFGRERIHALILDVRLGAGPTGLDVLKTLRARPELATVPVLILTGAVLSDAEEASIARHRAFLFHKPEGFDTLLAFLDQLTGRDQPH